jgi:hypothetical protein
MSGQSGEESRRCPAHVDRGGRRQSARFRRTSPADIGRDDLLDRFRPDVELAERLLRLPRHKFLKVAVLLRTPCDAVAVSRTSRRCSLVATANRTSQEVKRRTGARRRVLGILPRVARGPSNQRFGSDEHGHPKPHEWGADQFRLAGLAQSCCSACC